MNFHVRGVWTNLGDGPLASIVIRDTPEDMGIIEHTLSVQELSKKLLRENIKEAGLEQDVFEGVFDLLAHGKHEEALRLLSPER